MKSWYALTLVLLAGGTAAARQPRLVDLLLVNGKVYTGDAARPWVQSVAIRGDRVVAVGSDRELRRGYRARRTLDLGGRLAIPGINDAHDHPGEVPFGVEARTARPAMADPTVAEVAGAIGAVAKTAAAGEWIHANAGPAALVDAAAMRVAIDAVAGEHPVLVQAWWGHGAILNDKALALLGIDQSSTDPPGGRYERDAAGRLTGKLDEYAAWAVSRRLHSGAGVQRTAAFLKAYADRRLAEGVTSVQVMAGTLTPELFVRGFMAAASPLRVRLVPFPIPISGDPEGMDAWRSAPRAGGNVRVSGVKWVLDGTPIDQLAWRTRPYEGRPGWYGRLNFGQPHLEGALRQALATRTQVLFHAVGDATVAAVLDAMERLAPPERWRPLRVRIEHGEALQGEMARRAVRLGVVVAQPRPTAPLRDQLNAGLTVAYGSDIGFPPFVAFMQMTRSGRPQSISREEGLAVLTRAGAYAEGEEARKGRLRPGMLADIAVLSQDVLTVPAERLPGTTSVLTLIGGRIAYRAPGPTDVGESAGTFNRRDSGGAVRNDTRLALSALPGRGFALHFLSRNDDEQKWR